MVAMALLSSGCCYLQNLVLHLQRVHPADGVLLLEQKQTVVSSPLQVMQIRL